MAPKRKHDHSGAEMTGREKKKVRIEEARTIVVQPVPSSIVAPTNAVAGPSQPRVVNSMPGLPSAIDVEKFAEARAFEINAMHNAMRTASESSTQRAWQTLPRHLRRRAASHDVRRVPLRLREKARAEMDPVRKKALGRSMPKRGKDKRVSRTELLLKRQRDKTWLETHIWHAKRMKMENMWGYRLAVHPTEKAFRPSHRASVHGSILHDASYYSLIELKGTESILKTLLDTCCDPQGASPGAKRSTTGARAVDTHIYKPGCYPFDLIAPATIIWKPARSTCSTLTPPETSDITTALEAERTSKKGRQKGKAKAADPSIGPSDNGARVVWVRCHPMAFDDTFSALRTAASLTLDAIKKAAGAQSSPAEIEIADIRGQVNIFEIMGPKSSQVIKGALTPVSDDSRDEFKKFWSSLTDLQTSGSIPRGMIIGFKVNDPRLKFPPKNAKPAVSTSRHLKPALASFPSSTLAFSELWEESIRDSLKKPRYKKKDIDERRSKNLVPGTHLSPLRQDARIPVLLIQRSLEQPSTTGLKSSESIHGWTLIIPAGWSMPFFSSLTYTGTRVGGQRERQTQAFEAGTICFPRDYPSTASYDSYAEARAETEKARWGRKPPAKRVNFDKLGTRSPWKADWEVVLGLEEPPIEEEASGFTNTQREDTMDTTQEGEGVTQEDEEVIQVDEEVNQEDEEVTKEDQKAADSKIKTWLLRGTDVPAIVDRISGLSTPASALRDEIDKLRLKRLLPPLSTDIKADELWKTALIAVKLTMYGRGAPEDLALIYAVEDQEAIKWIKDAQIDSVDDMSSESSEEVELPDVKPPQSSVIGYVTTGNFSLSRGQGFTVGVVAVARLFDLQQQSRRLRPNLKPSERTRLPLVKIRDRDGYKCRAAHLELLDG